MSLKGFPSNQNTVLPTALTNNFVTVVPKNQYRHGLDTKAYVFRVGALQTAEASTGIDPVDGYSYVYSTATAAKVGDLVRFEDGPLALIELSIVKVETDRFLLPIKEAANPGDTFYILRDVSPRADEDGVPLGSGGGGGSSDVSFISDGVSTPVSEDTLDPNNDVGLPVRTIQSSETRIRHDGAFNSTVTVFGNGNELGITANGSVPVNSTDFGYNYVQAIALVDYSLTPLTAGTFLHVASNTSQVEELEIFDSSGEVLALAFGAPGSEVNQILIYPGGNGRIKIQIPINTDISVVSNVNLNAGTLVINAYGVL